MSGSDQSKMQRLDELLVREAISGLDDANKIELEALLEEYPAENADEYMQTATLVQLGMHAEDTRSHEKMPAALRDKVVDQAHDFFAEKQASQSANVLDFPSTSDSAGRAGPKSSSGAGAAWYVAAAACLVAIVAVLRGPGVPVEASIAAQRLALLETAEDVLQVSWQQPEIGDYAAVRGDVVWSTARQQGFMRLRDLPENDPAQFQYQLWIVDPGRDARPVDGGVFDVPSGQGEFIAAIDAKLEVANPAVFAITREQPGGVVVSQGPLLIIAKPPEPEKISL